MLQIKSEVINNEQLAEKIFRLTINSPMIAQEAAPGQFIMIKAGSGNDPLLRRPFSIHQVINNDCLQLLFKVVGKGTKLLAEITTGQEVDIIGPLGNSFKTGSGNVCLVGGGMGIAPMLFLANHLREKHKPENMSILLGAQNRNELCSLTADFDKLDVNIVFATDDGSMGHKGFVIDLMEPTFHQTGDAPWQVYCCGPYPMMNGIATLCKEKQWPCQVSMETMMACGMAACLGCTVESNKTNKKGGDYLHVCQDGPVFTGEEIKWKR